MKNSLKVSLIKRLLNLIVDRPQELFDERASDQESVEAFQRDPEGQPFGSNVLYEGQEGISCVVLDLS
jgi:hypothetical protein